MNRFLVITLALSSFAVFQVPAHAQQSFAGSTMQQPSRDYRLMQEQQQRARSTYYYRPAPPPAPAPPPVNPTTTATYRMLAPLEPYAASGQRFGYRAMSCAAGGMAFTAGGPVGMGVGCVSGVMLAR